MYEKNEVNKCINIKIPLTTTSGKIRVKKRSILNEYGIPVATKQTNFEQNHYMEWQIGYDVTEDRFNETIMKELQFTGANGKTKALYELSEYAKIFYDWAYISKNELLEIADYLEKINIEKTFIDNHNELSINRSHPIKKTINSFDFCYIQVQYPLLVYKFDNYEIVTEIIIKEKQRAIGVQPMLYLCFPITKLISEDGKTLLGRTANAKEFAILKFDKNCAKIILEMLKIFGILSEGHNHDVREILRVIIKN